MGLKLIILGLWTPKYIILRELENLSEQTTTALKALISKHSAEKLDTTSQSQKSLSIQQQRAAMAQTHTKLVETLAAQVGREEAVKQGRETMFRVGQKLGKQTRSKLGVNDNPKDLAKAAKILYRVLGIDFSIEWLGDSKATAIINHCALAEQYSELTCEILSATDEGVIKGLQPNATMKFKEYMTSGCKNCKADITFEKENTR